jgi:hypothetical protein
MQPITNELEPHLQKQVEAGSTGLDIIHGELKNLMLEAERSLEAAADIEELSGEAMDSMNRTYCEGMLDAYTNLYKLTYDLSFAIGERDNG